MVSPKIDLYKLKEEEWLKYKRMDKIATHEIRMQSAILSLLVLGAMILILIYAEGLSAPNIHKAGLMLNSLATQLNSTFKAGGIASVSLYNHTALITNNLASNPHALASVVMWIYGIGMFFAAVAPLVFTAILILILWLFLSASYFPSEIYSFKSLKRRLASLEHIRNTLKAHGFSEQEIDWYYEVRNETRKLLIKIGE
jgi:hypothetical protein